MSNLRMALAKILTCNSNDVIRTTDHNGIYEYRNVHFIVKLSEGTKVLYLSKKFRTITNIEYELDDSSPFYFDRNKKVFVDIKGRVCTDFNQDCVVFKGEGVRRKYFLDEITFKKKDHPDTKLALAILKRIARKSE